MRYFTFLFLLFFIGNSNLFGQIIEFPDPNFKNALLNHNPIIDTNADGEIQVSEAEATTEMTVSSQNIQSMEGIEYFTNLITLWCIKNDITLLDLTQNTALESVVCFLNEMETLLLPQSANLETLRCNNNAITSLDLSGSPGLRLLDCKFGSLGSLDASNNLLLEEIDCSFNPITTLHVSNCTQLVILDCYDNDLSELNLPTTGALKEVYASYNNLTTFTAANPSLERLELSYNNNLSTVDVSGSPSLIQVYIKANNLLNVNVKNGNNENLPFFDARENPLLTCIQVDDPDLSDTYLLWRKDESAYYDEFCVLGTEVVETHAVQLIPNPVHDVMEVQSLQPLDRVSIYSMQGMLLFHSSERKLDVSLLPSGLYIAQIWMGKNFVTRSFVKD
jgi:Secretion system C-terminal sorting domain